MRFIAALMVAVAWAGNAAAQPALQEKLKAVMADPAATKAAVDAGEKASFFCVNCHGQGGNSKMPEVPTLAAQNPAYILEQIRKFGAGERKNEFMQGMIKVLKDDERLQIALYYANSPHAPKAYDARLAERGRDIYTHTCVRCHGEKGLGNETIPRIAGQSAEYIVTSVTRYRDRTGERNNVLMSAVAASLRKEDIPAVANYLASLN